MLRIRRIQLGAGWISPHPTWLLKGYYDNQHYSIRGVTLKNISEWTALLHINRKYRQNPFVLTDIHWAWDIDIQWRQGMGEWLSLSVSRGYDYMYVFLSKCQCWVSLQIWIHWGLVTQFGDIDLGDVGSGISLLPDGTKPLPEQMASYHQ